MLPVDVLKSQDVGVSVPSTGGDRAEVVFSDDDLARVRISSSLELVSEVIGAAHRRHSQEQPTLQRWQQRIGDDLGPITAQVLQELRSGVFLIRGLLTHADIDTDLGFDHRLEASLSRPSRQWADPMRELRSWGIPVQPGLAEGRPAALGAISGAARLFHNAAVAPYWDQMSAAAVAPALAWMQTMSTVGLEALFNGLHPTITWRRPALSITADWRHCGPACPHRALMATMRKGGVARFVVSRRGLTIIPTILSPTCLLWFDPEDGPSMAARLLLVPIPIIPETLHNAGTSQADPLADLLGLTRACVLRACVNEPLTTTSLARTIGISNSSASEHAALLRSAGLIVSEREANRVVHRATDIGVALARNANISAQFAASQIHRRLSANNR